jgi:hypothetical protein
MLNIFRIVVGTLFISTLSSFGQLILDDFGPVAQGAAQGTWVGQVTQNLTSITVGGTALDDQGWARFQSITNGSTFSFIRITGQVDSGNIAPIFNVTFTDNSLNSVSFTTPTASFGASLTTVFIPIASWGAVNPNDISDWSIGGGTTGISSFRMTLDDLSLTTAIPEPASLSLGLAGGLMMLMVRRRRLG